MILVALLSLLLALVAGGADSARIGRPVPIGAGRRFHPPPGAHPVSGLRCTPRPLRRYGVHLELFSGGRAVIVPAGIGIAPPRRRHGAYVSGGRCSFPVRTREPTGVLEVVPRSGLTLGQLYRIWGRPLPGRARVFVNGLFWRGRITSVPLRRHAEIVVETDGYVRPHPFYRFPKGL